MKEKNIVLKIFLCSIYLVMIVVIVVCNYRLYKDKDKTIRFEDANSTQKYSYIDIYKMSEKFAYYEESNKGIHFVVDKEDNIYLIAINEKDYDKFKKIINYSYNKTDVVPKKIKVTGYPKKTSKELKQLSNKNIGKFISNKNQIDTYYLDTTEEKKDTFSIVLCISTISCILLIILFFITMFDKGKNYLTK